MVDWWPAMLVYWRVVSMILNHFSPRTLGEDDAKLTVRSFAAELTTTNLYKNHMSHGSINSLYWGWETSNR